MYLHYLFYTLMVLSWASWCEAALHNPIQAKVIATDPLASTLTLQIDHTKGPLTVDVMRADAQIGYVNTMVTGQLMSTPQGPRLEQIWPVFPRWIQDTAHQLHQDTQSRQPQPIRLQTQTFPVFGAIDQTGNLVNADHLKGKWTCMSFIFTRCQNPDMCPAITKKMVAIEKIFELENKADAQLFLFTFDPVYDTPGIFRNYADAHGVKGTYLHCLTGPAPLFKDLMTQIGIHARGDGDHTMVFLIVDPVGRIVYREEGNYWTIESALKQLKAKQLSASSMNTPQPKSSAPANA